MGMTVRQSRSLFAAGLLAFVAGCSGNVATSAEAADAESSSAAGVIVVERISGDAARGEAVARFVRGRSAPLDDQALRWLGLEPELPALGTCSRDVARGASMPSSGVRLLDVGRVTVVADPVGASAEPQTMELVRRRLPDVVDVVSGVVYTADATELPPRGSFEVRVVGEPELGSVRAQTDFVGEPANVRIQGQDTGGGVVVVSPDAPVDVAWDAAKSGDDLIYVDVSLPEAAGRKASVTRCVVADSGRIAVPAAAFGDADGSLVVHRVHRASFRASGIDRGELRLDFAREVPFAVHARR